MGTGDYVTKHVFVKRVILSLCSRRPSEVVNEFPLIVLFASVPSLSVFQNPLIS